MGQLRRRQFLIASSALLAAPLVARGHESGRVYHIGVIEAPGGEERLEREFADLGWIKGRNVSFVYRFSKVNDAFPALARELVRERVDILLTAGTAATIAAKRATSTIPIVFFTVGDPLGVGIVSSLNRPGGNVTGISGITYQLAAKRVELLNEALPGAQHFGVLLDRADPAVSKILGAIRTGLRSAEVTVEPFYAGRPDEIEPAFRMMKQHRVDGALVFPDNLFWIERPRIVKLAAELRLPTTYAFKEDVEAGGLMSYGADIRRMQAQAVGYVDKILRGAKPSTLPVQEPAKLELEINLKAAKALGLTIPESLLLSADRVIG
jgi:putative ABC transport system substrate-binding protein